MRKLEEVFIHPSVDRPEDLVLGRGSQIWAGTILDSRVVIGHACKIGKLCDFQTDVTIGNHVNVMPRSHFTKGLVIEDFAWIGPLFMPLNTKKIRHVRDFELKIEAPIIKFGARIGARVTVMPGVTIGEEALIDACSVVTKDVPDGEIWRGSPAKKIGEVPDEERIDLTKVEGKCEICITRYENGRRY